MPHVQHLSVMVFAPQPAGLWRKLLPALKVWLRCLIDCFSQCNFNMVTLFPKLLASQLVVLNALVFVADHLIHHIMLPRSLRTSSRSWRGRWWMT